MHISKRERDEARRREALRKTRWLRLVGILLHLELAWGYGLRGGGRAGVVRYHALEMEPKRNSVAKMMLGRLIKARQAYMDRIDGGGKLERMDRKFFEQSDKEMTEISIEVIKALPEEASSTEALIVLTYVVYAIMHDYRVLHEDDLPELKRMMSAFGSFADWLLPRESPMVEAMNRAYFAVRDEMLGHPDWTCGGELVWLESEQEKWLREREAE